MSPTRLTAMLVVVSVLNGTAALAQSAAPRPAKAPEATSVEDDPEKVSDPDKLRLSAESLQLIKATLKEVLGKVEEARALRDLIKMGCVNEKFTQVKGLLRISEQADVALQEAVARKQTEQAGREYRKVRIARAKVVQLRPEAEQCLGQQAFRTDENLVVDVVVPELILPNELTFVKTTLPSTIQPLPASPQM